MRSSSVLLPRPRVRQAFSIAEPFFLQVHTCIVPEYGVHTEGNVLSPIYKNLHPQSTITSLSVKTTNSNYPTNSSPIPLPPRGLLSRPPFPLASLFCLHSKRSDKGVLSKRNQRPKIKISESSCVDFDEHQKKKMKRRVVPFTYNGKGSTCLAGQKSRPRFPRQGGISVVHLTRARVIQWQWQGNHYTNCLLLEYCTYGEHRVCFPYVQKRVVILILFPTSPLGGPPTRANILYSAYMNYYV